MRLDLSTLSRPEPLPPVRPDGVDLLDCAARTEAAGGDCGQRDWLLALDLWREGERR